ncbi:MAG: putative baseplate assembly protein [Jatrophihabitans sp.]
MSLPAPNLDDRRFQDLVDDAKRLVQQRCPDWTDHNVSDPGVTLIETFAFMTDQLLYRLNRVPDRLYVTFLNLIGLRLRPPSAAVVPVTFWLSAPMPTTMVVPSGTRVSTLRTETVQAVVFTTTGDVQIPNCELSQVRSGSASDSAGESVAITTELQTRVPVTAFAATPQVDDVLLLGLDTAIPRCVLRVDFAGHVEGIGVDPTNPPWVWEAWTGESWQACEVSLDETGGFNRAGTVLVHVPDGHERRIIDGDAAAWIRVRLVQPTADQPSYRSSPVIDGLAVATVGGTQQAVHADLVDLEVLGLSQGTPGQSFELGRGPVLRFGEPVVQTSEQDGWQSWQLVDDFGNSGPDDRHVVVDHIGARLLFGPAVREPDREMRYFGTVPDKGATIRIGGYAVGGGRIGNVPSGAVQTLRSSIPFIARVENLRAAQGGVDGESLDEAKQRAPLFLRTRNRAVTVEDFEVFAREAAPDAARIRCVPSESVGAGAVKLLVVPAASMTAGRLNFEELVPQPEMLQRIADRLEQVRLIGTRLLIEPPRYRGITVVARLRARPRANPAQVRVAALDALYAFLNPLPGGGPDGTGWPFGRPVQSGEVLALLQNLPGVEQVDDVRLFSADPVTGERGLESARHEIERHSLVFSFDHHVRIQD